MVKIGIPGEYTASFGPHQATNDALHHAATALACEVEIEWMPTDTPEAEFSGWLETLDGVWSPPGSPYRSMSGALNAIRHARETGIPFIGTCGGYQHAVLEYARNVLGFTDAQHAEYDPYASSLFVAALSCSLAGTTMTVHLVPGSRAASLYGVADVREQYYCNFGLNPDKRPELEAAGLVVSGVDDDGEARVLELPGHPFYVATLFVPQTSSTPDAPHPLVRGFVEVASAQAATRVLGTSGLVRAR